MTPWNKKQTKKEKSQPKLIIYNRVSPELNNKNKLKEIIAEINCKTYKSLILPMF